MPPAVQALGNATGFDIELEDHGSLGHEGLIQARNQLLGLAARDPLLAGVRPNSLDDTPQVHIDIDQTKASALGVSLADINSTLSAAWGSSYINDFVDRRPHQTCIHARRCPLSHDTAGSRPLVCAHQHGRHGALSSFANASWTVGPAALTRYNGLPSIEIQGGGAPGISSGTAMQEMAKLFQQLPKDAGYELTGLSFEEEASGSQAPHYGLSILVIYLCLAALYESCAIPVSVMLVIPLGVIGALGGSKLARPLHDIYFQVGLLTTSVYRLRTPF